jgi:hypothetical protein
VTMMVEKECRREKFVETRLLPRSARWDLSDLATVSLQ